MPLNDLEVERQLTQRRLDTEQFKASLNNLTSLINKLQTSVNGIIATPTGVVITNGGGGGDSDSYPTAGGIVHRLLHIFQSAVQFLSTISITGIATFIAAPVFSSTTATRPLKVDGTKGLISGKIDLAAPTTDIQNTLGVPNGGTGAVTFSSHFVLLGNGAATFTAITPDTVKKVLGSNGVGADPSFQALSTLLVVGDDVTLAGTPITAHTLPLAKITPGGADGSITLNVNGRATAYVDPT